MIHYSCDRCKRRLDPHEDLRYTVKMEACAFMDSADAGEQEDDRDHLLEIHEIIERLDDESCDEIGEEIYRRLRFDLCADCYKKFLRNPVGREPIEQFGFSQN